MNALQHEDDSVAFKLFQKKFNTKFLHSWIDDLKSKQNEAINVLQLC